jgi:PST family polysaccharide transporter
MEEDSKLSPEGSSYRSILKSTSLIGGASILNILIGMVRTKFVAILIGPSGVGLLGMYGQVIVLITTITGMGIGSSGVRQVAEAVGTGDDERIARTVITLRRIAWLTGGFGLLVMVVFCVPLSRVTFGTKDYAWPIAALGISLLTGAISSGQLCIINGSRRIGDLAKISILGAASGMLISIPCFYLWEEAGIVPSLVLSALVTVATSWWYARRVPVKAIRLPWHDSYCIAWQLLSLGASFMGAGLVTALSGYLIRIVLLRHFDIIDVGIYQAAYNLSGVLVGFVLGAMSADYYPRLTAAAGNNVNVHRIVNEQLQISILLSLPGLAVMMIFAPQIIQLLYADAFSTAVPILRWCILGILGRVFSWPVGIVILAKGNGKVYLTTESLAAIIHLTAIFFLVRFFGLNGAGIAFMVLYVFYTMLVLFVMRRLIGASWNRHTIQLALGASIIMILLMVNCTFNKNLLYAWSINLAVLFGIGWFCLKQLLRQTRIDLQALLVKLYLKIRRILG